MKFETKLNKLEIDTEEVKSIIMNCECGKIRGAYLIEMDKIKKSEIIEVIGSYLNSAEMDVDWIDITRISTLCKAFDISEEHIREWYVKGLNEYGAEICYELTSNPDVVLVLTEDERFNNSFIPSPSQNDEDDDDEEMGFDEYFDLINYEEIPHIIKKLNNENHFCKLNKDDWKTLRDYHKQLEHELQFKEVDIRNNLKPERCKKMYSLLEEEYDKINHIMKYQVGRTTRVSIYDMNQKVKHLWMHCDETYFDGFFEFKELCEMINAYFGIKKPYKPANKIAYGWNFSLKKGFKAFRHYFFACLRNYLQKNDIEFKTSDLQKICCLKDITDEDC